MYTRISFRGAKTGKIGKKGMFWVRLTNFGKDMTHKLRKTHAKTRIFSYLKSMCLGCLLKVVLQE